MLNATSVAEALEEDTDCMEQLGEYRVRRLIGEGGMGKVYEGEERLSKRRVALKVLHPELSKSEQARKLFLNEMQILARVEHPNVVRSLSSLEVNGELVMVLEFLDGRTLRQVLADRGRYRWVETVELITRVASALAAAHGQTPPIIHRDLKPENIMVLNDGTVKVMDFGIAKVVEAMNQTNTQSVGTLQYMSPEQIDAHTIDHRSDLYCLGLIFFELLEGRPPFVSSSPRQLLNLQCTADPPALAPEVRENLPSGVEAVLYQLLEKAPEDRPYLAEDVIAALDPFLPKDRSNRGAGATTSRSRQDSARTTPQPSPRPFSSEPAILAAGRSQESPSSEALDDRRSPEPIGLADRPPRADTIALLERPSEPREVSKRTAVLIILGLSLLSGLVAYGIRSNAVATKAATSSTPSSTSSAKPRR